MRIAEAMNTGMQGEEKVGCLDGRIGFLEKKTFHFSHPVTGQNLT